MPRSEAQAEGLELLKQGCVLLKCSRKGKPTHTTFKLSADERMLCWERTNLLSKAGGKWREVELTDVSELLVGRDSAAFQRATRNESVLAEAIGAKLA